MEETPVQLTPEERISALVNPQVDEEPTDSPAAVDADPSLDTAQEEETAQAESDPPDSPDADAKDGDSEAETITVSSLAELMESIGADADSMYDLTVPVTINGERQDIPLSEVKDSIRATKEAVRFQDEAKQAREAAKQYAEQSQEQVKQVLAQAQRLSDGLDAMYLAPFQNVNWAELRTDDPAEYAAKRQEFLDTQNAVNQQKQAVLAEIEAFKKTANEQQQESQNEVLAREREALNQKWPEMASDKGDAERSALVEFLKSDGFSDDEIGSLSDHRTILLVRDAMRHREQAKKASVAKKRVIKIGTKVLTPGAAQSKAQATANRLNPLRDKVRKTGHINDVAALLSQSIQGRK